MSIPAAFRNMCIMAVDLVTIPRNMTGSIDQVAIKRQDYVRFCSGIGRSDDYPRIYSHAALPLAHVLCF